MATKYIDSITYGSDIYKFVDKVSPDEIFWITVTTHYDGFQILGYSVDKNLTDLQSALADNKLLVLKDYPLNTVYFLSHNSNDCESCEFGNSYVFYDGYSSIIEGQSWYLEWNNSNNSYDVYFYASDAARAIHTHGNISNSGSITANAVNPATGDNIVITSGNSNEISKGPAFDTTDTTKYLRHDGTWQTVSSTDTITGWYGTCSTDAATTTKVVTCSGYTLTTGNIIGILFSTANTAATPQLNINSTGAKYVYIGNSVTNGTTNILKWSVNTMIYFMYDGTNYRYLYATSAASTTPPRGANTWYGICSTAADTQAKTSTIDNYVLTKGSLVSLNCTAANTYTSAKITLNINSTGANDVYYNNAVTSSTNTLLWDAGETLTFMYDGTYYRFVSRSKAASPATVTLQQLQTGTDTTGYLISPKVLADYIASLDATNVAY